RSRPRRGTVRGEQVPRTLHRSRPPGARAGERVGPWPWLLHRPGHRPRRRAITVGGDTVGAASIGRGGPVPIRSRILKVVTASILFAAAGFSFAPAAGAGSHTGA